SLHFRQVEGNEGRPSDGEQPYLHTYRYRSNSLDVRLDQIKDLVRILIGHETAADLCASRCRNNRFRTGTCVSTPETIDVERWAGGNPFLDGISLITPLGSSTTTLQ